MHPAQNDKPFVIQSLDDGQFLSPAIQTMAISKLTHYMEVWFFGAKRSICDKPTCVMCFDMPGTGKTTTIMEAWQNSKSIFCHISLICNPLFTELFSSCQKFGEKQDHPFGWEDSVSYEAVEKYMVERFDTVLRQPFQRIISLCTEELVLSCAMLHGCSQNLPRIEYV